MISTIELEEVNVMWRGFLPKQNSTPYNNLLGLEQMVIALGFVTIVLILGQRYNFEPVIPKSAICPVSSDFEFRFKWRLPVRNQVDFHYQEFLFLSWILLLLTSQRNSRQLQHHTHAANLPEKYTGLYQFFY